jgi:anti-sigma factor RsiW
MDCRDVERFAQLRLDGEIEAVDCMSLDRHLEACVHCRERVERERIVQSTLSAKLKEASSLSESQCPAAMRTRILARTRADERARAFPLARASLAASAVGVLAVVSWGATLSGSGSSTALVEETVARHSSNLPPEFRAPDEDEVHRFLERNLRYPVQVPHLGRNDAPVRLVGARLSNISDRDAAYVMYDQRGAKVSLFAVPAPRRLGEPEGFERRTVGQTVYLVGQRRGYNVVSWRDRDLFYSLVSDVDPGELVRLASTASAH